MEKATRFKPDGYVVVYSIAWSVAWSVLGQ